MNRLADISTGKRRWVALLGLLVLLAGAALVARSFFPEALVEDLPTDEVKKGEFRITLVETGELQAAWGEKIEAPEVRGRLLILFLWPEGARVDVGDLVLQFDKTEFERRVLDREGELDEAQSDFTKAEAQAEQQLSGLKIQIEQEEAALELARISQQKAQFGTPVQLEEAGIRLQQAERLLQEAKEDLKARTIAARVDLQNHRLNIARKQKRYDRIYRDYQQLDVYAPSPGIVVYHKIRQPGGDRKVRVGDQVWGGATVLSIPDLSQMQVIAQVGEADIKRVKIGQQAFIRLDASPGVVFRGQVAKVSPMANPREDAPNIQVFETIIDIQEQDERLKPGMSVAAEIVVETIPDVLSIPLEAVFEQDGKNIVYCLRGRFFEPVEVELGGHNATSIVVESGLEEGEKIALEAPIPD